MNRENPTREELEELASIALLASSLDRNGEQAAVRLMMLVVRRGASEMYDGRPPKWVVEAHERFRIRTVEKGGTELSSEEDTRIVLDAAKELIAKVGPCTKNTA